MSYVNPKVASKYFNVYEKHHLHMEYRRKNQIYHHRRWSQRYLLSKTPKQTNKSNQIKSNQIKVSFFKKKTRDKKQKFKYLIMSYVNPKVVMYVKTPHENQTYPIPLDVSDYFF